MDSEHFDCVVIGGGSAGYAAARTVREGRDRVAIVDASETLGGLCILRGCMPSKTLIYSAEVLHHARHGELFGLRIPETAADMKAVRERKIRMVDDFRSYREEQLRSDRFTLFQEQAAFVDRQTIELQPSGRRLTADSFVVATGSAINWPAIPGLEQENGIWTSDDILELDFLPPSLIMLGGGIVACELAQYLQRMGTQVTLIQRSPRILKETSAEAADVITRVFREEGMTVWTDTHLERIEKTGDGFRVHFQHGGEPCTAEAAHLCNALGRKANVADLCLACTGVEQRANGQIMVDQFQQSNNPHIYAAGDVAGPFEIVHLAVLQGEVAGAHILGRDPSPIDYKARTGIVFTDPQIASVGLTPSEARGLGHDIIEASYPFDDHGKSILMEARAGYVLACADRRTGCLLGAECVGKDGGELIHSLAVAVALRADVRTMAQVQWYHPTLSEIWSYPLEDLAERVEG